MRKASDELVRALQGSFQRRILVDVFHGSDRVMRDVVATNWSFEGDLSAAIKHSGTFTVYYQSDNGESLVPLGLEGILSPFRATLLISVEISSGDFIERVPLGWGRVVSIPSAEDVTADILGVETVVMSRVEVSFQSLEVNMARRGFRFPEQPVSLSSVYKEIRRITDMPVVEDVADKQIPAATVYEAKEGGRLEAVQLLFGILGGQGVVDPYGAWSLVTDEWGDPVATLQLGDEGTVTEIPYSVESEGVYNCVVGNFENPNTRTPITSVAVVTSGRLSVDGEYGEYTKYIEDDQIITQAQADARVQNELSKITVSQQYEADIQCIVNPLLELGDVVEVTGWHNSLKGRVIKYSISDATVMTVTLLATQPTAIVNFTEIPVVPPTVPDQQVLPLGITTKQAFGVPNVQPEPPAGGGGDTFVLGVTQPSLTNTGPRVTTFTNYTGAVSGSDTYSSTTKKLVINTAGRTFTGVNFGTTWIDVRAANVTFRDCKWTNTLACMSTDRGMISATDGAVSNLLFEFCSWNNAPGSGVRTARFTGAVTGHDFTMRRCNIRNFTDGLGVYVTTANSGGPLRVTVEGTYITDLSWWYDSTSGVVHPSDVKTHNDCIQWQGGTGLVLTGNYFHAKYSTTVGTMYTTHTTGDKRWEIVDGSGAYTTYHNGGSLAAIMVTEAARGTVFAGSIKDGWYGGGGAMTLNAGDDGLTGNFGTVWRNRFYRDQRAVDWAINIDASLTADCGIGTSNRNIWIDDGTEVPRKNG